MHLSSHTLPSHDMLLLPVSYYRFGEHSSLPVISGEGNGGPCLSCASMEMQSL